MAPHALLQRLTLATILAVGLAACGPSIHQETARHTDALIVCPAAEAVSWVPFEGTDQLSYQVKVEYPADSIISCISKKLSENRWQPLKEDFWNPGLPSSQVRGWTQFTDVTVHPEATVDAWASQWQNQAGDIAWYYLQYKYPPKDRYTLFVNAGFIPADKAKKEPKTPQAGPPLSSQITEVLNAKEPGWKAIAFMEERVPLVPSEKTILTVMWESPKSRSEDVSVSVYGVASGGEAVSWLKPVRNKQVAPGWQVSVYQIGDEGYLSKFQDGKRFDIEFRRGKVVCKIAGNDLGRVKEFAKYIVDQIPTK